MKITVEHRTGAENEIVLRCASLDEEMLEVLSFLKDRVTKIPARRDGALFMLMPDDVYYAESVDGNTFLYTKDAVYETRDSLAVLEVKYESAGYVRIHKSQLVNLRHIKALRSTSDRRIEITLNNAERMIVSRHYAQDLKIRLGITR